MNALTKRNWREHLIPVCILLSVALLFSMTTFFFYFSKQSYGHDAGIFAYIGMAMKEGRVLYTEVWENKGPLLYFINMLGVMLNYRHGIFWLELIFLITAILFAYKTALFFSNKWIALTATIFAFIPLTATLESGNLAEEYALPFLMIAIYYVTKFFIHQYEIKRYEMAIVGACGGACLLLRANLLALFVAMFIVVTIALCKRKEVKKWISILFYSLCGCIAICMPFVLYLTLNGALKECLFTAYIGILNDYLPLYKAEFLKNITVMVQNMVPSGSLFFVFVYFVGFIGAMRKKNIQNQEISYILWFSFLALIINFFANILTGAMHMHYFMSFIPLFVIPYVWLLNYIYRYFERTINLRWVSFILVFSLCFFIGINAISGLPLQIINQFQTESTPRENYTLIANYITNHSTKEDTIQTFGEEAAVTAYYHAQRLSASKYSYYANGRFSDAAKSRFIEVIVKDCHAKLPKVILFQKNGIHQDFLSRLTDEQKQTWTDMLTQHYTLQKVDFGSIVYLRNE